MKKTASRRVGSGRSVKKTLVGGIAAAVLLSGFGFAGPATAAPGKVVADKILNWEDMR